MIFLQARWVVGRRRFASLIPSGCRLTPIHKADVVVGAPCKLLCIKHLTKIRVMIFTTPKIPKALIFSKIRVAHPWGVTLETIMRVATRTDTVSQT